MSVEQPQNNSPLEEIKPEELHSTESAGKIEKQLATEIPALKEEAEDKDASTERIERIKRKIERIQAVRLSRNIDNQPVNLTKTDKQIIEETAEKTYENLNKCFKEGFGIFPSGNPKETFYNTLWSRDLANAGGNFFARSNEEAMLQSLETVFSHQKPDGSLPYRVERKRFLLEHTPRALFGVDFNWFKKIGIDLITRKKERPVYEGQDGGNAEDTIPATIVAMGELFIYSEQGRAFVKDNFDKIENAMKQFIGRTDPSDGLEKSKKMNPDWADSLLRGGKKLGTINIWYARALKMMQLMADGVGKPNFAFESEH